MNNYRGVYSNGQLDGSCDARKISICCLVCKAKRYDATCGVRKESQASYCLYIRRFVCMSINGDGIGEVVFVGTSYSAIHMYLCIPCAAGRTNECVAFMYRFIPFSIPRNLIN